MDIMEAVTIVCLLIALAVQEFRHGKERQDLYNRIMAKDFIDYKQPTPTGKRVVRNIIRKNIQKQGGVNDGLS